MAPQVRKRPERERSAEEFEGDRGGQPRRRIGERGGHGGEEHDREGADEGDRAFAGPFGAGARAGAHEEEPGLHEAEGHREGEMDDRQGGGEGAEGGGVRRRPGEVVKRRHGEEPEHGDRQDLPEQEILDDVARRVGGVGRAGRAGRRTIGGRHGHLLQTPKV